MRAELSRSVVPGAGRAEGGGGNTEMARVQRIANCIGTRMCDAVSQSVACLCNIILGVLSLHFNFVN